MDKELRAELRASATAALLVAEVNDGDHELARGDLVLLDALDEMERERDEWQEAARTAGDALLLMERQRDEVRAEVERLRALSIRRLSDSQHAVDQRDERIAQLLRERDELRRAWEHWATENGHDTFDEPDSDLPGYIDYHARKHWDSEARRLARQEGEEE